MGRRALVLVLALVLAGVAAFAIFQYLASIENDILADQEQIPVFRAGQAIPEGTEGSIVLQSEGVLFAEGFEEREDIPADAITTREDLNQVLATRVAAGPISQNAVLTFSQWVQLTVDITPLAELIPAGKQALAVAPDTVSGVNGFVQPGDRVNVIVTVEIDDDLTAISEDAPDLGIPLDPDQEETTEEEQTLSVTYTRFVLQGLPVLAVGGEIRPDPGETPTVEAEQVSEDPATGTDVGAVQEEEAVEVNTTFTLEVTPEEAERLVFAQSKGTIYFTLVPEDFEPVDTVGVTIDTLFEGDLVADIFGN